MTRPYVALTPAQDAALTVLDRAATEYADAVSAVHCLGYDVVTDAVMARCTGWDIYGRDAAARDRALELGLLVGDATRYAHKDVTP